MQYELSNALTGPSTGIDSFLNGSNVTNMNEESNWSLDAHCLPPAWFAGGDFDLNALNSSFIVSAIGFTPPSDSANNMETNHAEFQPSTVVSTTRQEDIVRQNWFTYLRDLASGHKTLALESELTEVDEAYRESLVDKLQQRVTFSPLPSTDFLNLCIQMYFTKFNPIPPIVHAATFRPSAQSSLLLLSIFSIGSLFVGSFYAKSQGLKIFETLNKAILTSWERYVSQGKVEAFVMIQAAFIGQTFGLLSGRPKDLMTVHMFHGTLVAWATRYITYKASEPTNRITHDDVTSNPEKAWRLWIRAEEPNRLLAGIHIHDAEISELFITDPFLRHSPSKRPAVSEDSLWTAPTAQEWSRIYNHHLSLSESPQSHSPTTLHAQIGFREYLELEEITASIPEGRNTSSPKYLRKSEQSLVRFYDSHIGDQKSKTVDVHCLMILWYSAFISLYADINRLELAIGKEDDAQRHTDYAREWACSNNGRRCALHGVLMLRELEKMRLGNEPAIHVSRALFRAAIIWYCYTKFGSDNTGISPKFWTFRS